MKTNRKAGYRWKNNVTFKVHIDTASGAQMWRVRTAAGVSGPQPIEQLNVPVTIKLGAGTTYEGTVTVKRIRGRKDDFLYQ